MIISHKHKFIFIKTKKTAGTSIEIALSKFCGAGDVITPITPVDEIIRTSLGYRGPQNYLAKWHEYGVTDWGRFILRGTRPQKFYAHLSAIEIRDKIGFTLWDNYFKFCFERNPWDKVISFYYWQYKSKPRPTLTEFIRSGEAELVSNDGGLNLYSIDGKIGVDKIYRYEEIEQEMTNIAKILDLGESISLPKAKAEFRQQPGCYKKHFSEQDKDDIYKMFHKEIEYFNYTF